MVVMLCPMFHCCKETSLDTDEVRIRMKHVWLVCIAAQEHVRAARSRDMVTHGSRAEAAGQDVIGHHRWMKSPSMQSVRCEQTGRHMYLIWAYKAYLICGGMQRHGQLGRTVFHKVAQLRHQTNSGDCHLHCIPTCIMKALYKGCWKAAGHAHEELCCAVLCCAVQCRAVVCCAVLAVLCCVVLCSAVVCFAVPYYAFLCRAMLLLVQDDSHAKNESWEAAVSYQLASHAETNCLSARTGGCMPASVL